MKSVMGVIKKLRPAITLFILLTLITGVIYPLLVTGVGRLFFPDKVDGSFIIRNDKIIGSALIGQNFTDPKYFWGRPSATVDYPYNASASGGSNLGPLNPALIEQVKQRIHILQQYPHPTSSSFKSVPVDLVTASASGIDPHISPAAAFYQILRVAAARGVSQEKLRELVQAHIQNNFYNLFTTPVVNVLLLNIAVDELDKTL